MSASPRIWVLLGHRRGDNNQLLALAEALGVPFETRTLSYRQTARPIMRLFPRSIGHLTSNSRATLAPPWPDLVIGIGRRSVAVALWIKRQSGGRTRLVRLGHPRAPSRLFDLVLTTPQYPVAEAHNVITLPLALNRYSTPPVPTDAERAFLDRPRPHVLLSLGGNAPMWELDQVALAAALDKLLARAEREGGTLFIAPSPRTPKETLSWLEAAIAGRPDAAMMGSAIRYAVALSDADLHAVTADSVSMISETVLTGRPVALIPVRPTRRGNLRLGDDPASNRLRDPRRFWSLVEKLGLAGTVDAPRRGEIPDPLALAVAEIRRRFAELFRSQT